MRGVLVAIISLALLTPLSATRTPQRPRSIADGVYSQRQANDGGVLYRRHCEKCHGSTLKGTRLTPPLTQDFLKNWSADSLWDLFNKIVQTMPAPLANTATRPIQLKREETVQLLAFLLKRSGMPHGTADLPSDDASLAKIRILIPR